MVRRLGRPPRPSPQEVLFEEIRCRRFPGENAARCTKKKSPGLGTLADVIEGWLQAWPPQTHNFQIGRELRAAFGHLKPRQLNPFSIDALTRKWRDTYAPATIHGRTLALRRFLKLLDSACGTQLRHTVPPAKNPGARRVIATSEELHNLFAKAQPWQRLWLLLCSQLALRNAEARGIGPNNYDATQATIQFKKKGGTLHTLPITEEIAAMFHNAPDPPEGEDTWTFTERWAGKKMTKAAVEYQWRTLKKKAKVRIELRAHDLRRTTAVTLYNLTHDIRTVSHLLGHVSIMATCGYLAHQDPQTLRPLLAQMKPLTDVKQ
jgi:site-specific recombinase XerD